MVGHQTIGDNLKIPIVCHLARNVQESRTIFRLKKDILAIAASIHDVIPGTGIFDAQWPAHDDIKYKTSG